jgi:VWFA-related protein
MTATRAAARTFRLPAVLLGAGLAAAFSGAAADPPAASPGQTRFRSAVDVIAVDVQVVDGDGNPIGQIGPGAFEVSINGQRRNVVSAQFIRQGQASVTQPEPDATRVVVGAEAPDGGGRTFILAIDSGSFEVGAERAPMEGARGFVQHLDPKDRVGLFVFPTGARLDPTTERAPLVVHLDRVIGQKDTIRTQFNLRPWEIVDITAQSTNPTSFGTTARERSAGLDLATAMTMDPVLKVQARECPNDFDCPHKIIAEGMQLVTQLERQVQASLSGLEALLRALAEVPGRKAVVLVSAGVLVSDRTDGRPDVGDIARVMGQTAARANATVYTVHIDTTSTGFPPSNRGAGSSQLARDRALNGNWLSDFSQSAGGRLIYVPVGTAGFAFDRVLRETSAYYLLGVEPADADRDGQPRQLRVKVNRRGVNVRSRQWVVVPAKS